MSSGVVVSCAGLALRLALGLMLGSALGLALEKLGFKVPGGKTKFRVGVRVRVDPEG